MSNNSSPQLEKIMLYDKVRNICVILSPNGKGSLVIEATNGRELYQKGLQQKLLHPLFYGAFTELPNYISQTLASRRIKVGDTLPKEFEPELGKEFTAAFFENDKITIDQYIDMMNHFNQVALGRDIEFNIPRHANPLDYIGRKR